MRSLVIGESGGDDNLCCSAEEIFELCEGSLETDRARVVRLHLRECSECRNLYDQEKSLSVALSGIDSGSDGYSGTRGGTACSVALALPTRQTAAKIMWGAGGAVLLSAVLFSLALYSVQPISFAIHSMGVIWGLTSGLSDAAGVFLAVSGSTILVALIVGIFVDALIAATLLAVARWWRLRGA